MCASLVFRDTSLVRGHNILAIGAALVWLLVPPVSSAQQPAVLPPDNHNSIARELGPAPDKLDIRPAARDDEIQLRLHSVLTATGWFANSTVRVETGVVLLAGEVDSPEVKKWAGDLARNTQGVVAVANKIQIRKKSLWDFSPAWSGLRDMWSSFIGALPLLVFALATLALSALAGVVATRGANQLLQLRIRARLLRSVAAHAAGVLVFLVGAYIVLRISGLTQLALTLLGGTGLVGLALGIAFRTIAENFLASISLSIQRPFEPGDLIEVAGVTGYVQQLNLRTTILMNLDGNLVQIPNATVFNSTLCNFTTNPERRTSFEVGIGYDDSIQTAQEIVREVLAAHPAVLQEPAPAVLVESLGRSTVNLHIYFWLNGRDHSWQKVLSSVIRLVKLAFQKHGISMPDEAREVIFPLGVPVHVLQAPAESDGQAESGEKDANTPGTAPADASSEVSSKAEDGLSSEAADLEKQARKTPLRESENLLRTASDPIKE